MNYRSIENPQVGLILESGEVNVVHHVCVLMGFGLDAVCPYLVFETVAKMRDEGVLEGEWEDDTVAKNFQKSVDYGMRKVRSLGFSFSASGSFFFFFCVSFSVFFLLFLHRAFWYVRVQSVPKDGG